MATPKADLDPLLDAVIRKLQETASADAAARMKGGQVPWLLPAETGTGDDKWDGNVFNVEGISKSFDRSFAQDLFVSAIADAADAGTVGDTVIAALQAEYVAVMERAFRARHGSGRIRMMAHATGRRSRHGADVGALRRNVIEFINALVQENKKT